MPRGVGYGAAFAVIVLTLVTLMGTYYIVRTYSSGMATLMNYAEALQKPQLEVADYKATTDGRITVTIVNKGPGGATVEGVKLLKQEQFGIPTGATPASNINRPVYLPVGGRLTAEFQVQDIADYVFWEKPLRVIVETNRGLYTLAHPTLTGTIYVNIHMPTWLGTAPNGRTEFYQALELEVAVGDWRLPISLSSALNVMCPQTVVSQHERFFRYKICSITSPQGATSGPQSGSGGDTVVIALDSLAGVEYTLRLKGTTKVPLIQYPNTWTDGQPERMEPRFMFTAWGIEYASVASVAPGSTTEVSFTIPDVFWRHGGPKPTPQDIQSSWVLDFSWLFNTMGSPDNSYFIGIGNVRDFGDGKLSVEQKILTLAGRIVYTGLVTYTNPYGCDVYPRPVPPNDVHPQPPEDASGDIVKDAYRWSVRGEARDYKHTGIPIILVGSRCSKTPRGGTTILEVSVKLPLRGGGYIVIPVFTYDDDDRRSRTQDGSFRAAFAVSLYGPGGQLINYAITLEGEERGVLTGGPSQYAVPLAVNVENGGVHTLKIEVIWYDGDSGVPKMVLHLSKVVVIPMDSTGDACLYKMGYRPSYPWVAIDTATGNMEDYARANVAPIYVTQDISFEYSEAYVKLDSQSTSPMEVVRFATTPRPDQPLDRFSFAGRTLATWPYKNLLTSNIVFRARVTPEGDDRFQHAYAMVAVRNGWGYIRSPLPIWNIPLYVTTTAIMAKGYFFVVAAEYYYLDRNPNQPDRKVEVEVEVYLPSNTYGYQVLIPYVFKATFGQYESPPQISVEGNVRVVEGSSPSLDSWALLRLKAPGGRAQTLKVKFVLPVPPITERPPIYLIPLVYSYLGIGPIAVVEDPDNRYYGQNFIKEGARPGIILLNVEGILRWQPTPVYVKVFDEDGAQMNRRDEFNPPFGERVGIWLGVEVFIDYLNYVWWTYPYKDMYVVVYNAKCRNPGQTGALQNLVG